MKYLFTTLSLLILTVCSNLCSNLSITYAQQAPTLPVDPNVRIGKLDNGLTYYIRKNKLPENRVDFYIAQKVGSIQEEENQRGLAHFLEHMCFNGTTHFPGDGLKQYLETIGVKFGENLNAYTSIDETVYMITNVPAIRDGIINSCLLILHDWSHDLLLDGKEIDKERGVINEEWRTRMSASQRLMEKSLQQIYAGTRYAHCFPIGNMDIVMNFKYQTLRDYYEKWYRPDLQGIIIVGDIDINAVENKIKTTFADIPPTKADAEKRIYYPVNDNKEPIIVIEQDKEQPYIQAYYFNKHDAVPREQKNNTGYLIFKYAKSLIGNMLTTRLEELRQSPNPPFIYAAAFDSKFYATDTKDAFTGIAVCKEDDIENGLKTIIREIERARRFGFTESEYIRARAKYLRALESAFNEKDKTKNDSYSEKYIRNFLNNEPIPGIEQEYTLLSQIAPNIPVASINLTIQNLISDTNQVITLFAPEKEGLQLPTKERILQLLDEVKKEELTPYEDQVSDEPLMTQKPKPGKIVSETKDPVFGTTKFTLSNGVKVIIKQTDFKADEIQMKGVSLGGTSLFNTSEAININALNNVIKLGGIGHFSVINLEKNLAGKKASVQTAVGDKTEAVTGYCSPKDFETLMQLTYLTFTAPRKDTEAFDSYRSRTKATLQNQELEPTTAFIDSINSAVYMNHPRFRKMKANMVDSIDYERVMEMYKDRFKDASDFTFIFVGNIDPDKVKPLIQEYLGALPATNRKETFRDNKIGKRKGIYKNEFIRQQETTKASVFVLYNGTCSYTLKNNILMDYLEHILTLLYTEKVREDEGGTYGVFVKGNLNKYPKEEFSLQIIFDTHPEKKDKLTQIIFTEIDNFCKTGPTAIDLNKTKEYLLKKHKEDLKENDYWLKVIDEYLLTGINLEKEYENVVNSINIKEVQTFAEKLFSQKNKIEVTMISPEKK